MKHHFAALIGAVILFPWHASAAPATTHACGLLTGAEIGSAVGTQAGPAQENNVVIPEGPSKGQTIAMCAWRLGPRDIVRVSVAPALQGASRAQGLASLNQSFDAMKAQGWREDAKSFGDIRCSTMTPPPAERDAPLMTGCMGEVKGMAVSISSMSATKQVAIEPVKDLFDKAAERLP
jgi:hypothetical protein